MWIAEVAEQQMKELYISKEIKQAKSFLSSHDCKREWWKQEKKRIYQPNQTWLLKLPSTAEEKKKTVLYTYK